MVSQYDVVIATCNGSDHILDQLVSIASQSILPARVIVGDDISCDNTLNVNNWSLETRIPTLFFLQRPFDLALVKILRNYYPYLVLPM